MNDDDHTLPVAVPVTQREGTAILSEDGEPVSPTIVPVKKSKTEGDNKVEVDKPDTLPAVIHVGTLRGCARCGGEHERMEFKRLTHPYKDTFSHWAMCPDLDEPILMEVQDSDEKVVEAKCSICGALFTDTGREGSVFELPHCPGSKWEVIV